MISVKDTDVRSAVGRDCTPGIVRLVGGKYTSYSQGKAECKSSFSV